MNSGKIFSAVLVLGVVIFMAKFCATERLGFGAKCIEAARNCTVIRLRHQGLKYVRAVFKDGLYHYCLEVKKCQVGKEQVCHKVGGSDQVYSDLRLRRNLLRQCAIWRIPVQFARNEEMFGHYIYFDEK